VQANTYCKRASVNFNISLTPKTIAMKVLVTGSRGFVGSRLVSVLKGKGHSAKEFDLALGNNLLDKSQCEKACKGIDTVYHLAAVLDEESPELYKVNVEGTGNILNGAAKTRVKQFVYLSSVGVNAKCKGIVNEKSAFKPATGYEKSKALAEQLVVDSQEMLPITIVRSALVFGPNRFWKLIAKLVEKGFPIIGDGKQVWQTIYVDDLVSALAFVLGKEQCLGETFVVAEKEKHSLLDLYAEIQKQLGIEGEIKTMPVWLAKLGALVYRLEGKKTIVSKEHIERLVRTRHYDTGKIEALDWKARTRMKEAVRKTLEGLRD